MFRCEFCKISSNNCFEEHLHTATSENNKNTFLGKATDHSDHYIYDKYITAVMAGNGTFLQKSITQYRKIFITQPKYMIFC